MRGAPQVGFSAAMRRIRARISAFVDGRPGSLARDFHLQYLRKPSRCQRTTVSGWTRTNTSFHRGHTRRRTTQKKRSAVLMRGRGRLTVRTASCWRRARFSRRRSLRAAKSERNQPAIAAMRGSIARGWKRRPDPSTGSRCREWQYHQPHRNSLWLNADGVVARDRVAEKTTVLVRGNRRTPSEIGAIVTPFPARPPSADGTRLGECCWR